MHVTYSQPFHLERYAKLNDRSLQTFIAMCDTAVEHSKQLVERMATEPDFAEGVAAFTEKRLPRWSGKPEQ